MLESYVTPLLMSYVNKYIKNLKPSDLQLSLWGGDVVLSKLDLRLDVLEQVLNVKYNLCFADSFFYIKPRHSTETCFSSGMFMFYPVLLGGIHRNNEYFLTTVKAFTNIVIRLACTILPVWLKSHMQTYFS